MGIFCAVVVVVLNGFHLLLTTGTRYGTRYV